MAKKAIEALDTVGMTEFSPMHIGTLSGGQLQRVLFARLLVMQPSVILLDEPFTGIDIQTIRTLLVVIRQLHLEGRTILAVLHDMEQVEKYFPHVLMLSAEGHRWGEVPIYSIPSRLQPRHRSRGCCHDVTAPVVRAIWRFRFYASGAGRMSGVDPERRATWLFFATAPYEPDR